MNPPFTELVKDLAAAGFDLAAALPIGRYNAVVETAYNLPDFGSGNSSALVIGSTRAFWPVFLKHLRAHPDFLNAPDPVDRYVEQVVRPIVEKHAAEVRFELRFAHEPPPRRVAMQALADVAGLAQRSPSCLSVHPECGPWIALRAAVVFDLPFEGIPTPATDLCGPCEKPCLPAFERALSKTRDALDPVAADWRVWVEVRDACPVGKAHRYGDEQVEYHYAKSIDLLRALLKRPE